MAVIFMRFDRYAALQRHCRFAVEEVHPVLVELDPDRLVGRIATLGSTLTTTIDARDRPARR